MLPPASCEVQVLRSNWGLQPFCFGSICGRFPPAGIAPQSATNSIQVSALFSAILPCMQESIANPPVHGAGDFAGLLAALAAAKPSVQAAWSDDELPQDVATLSYERAIQAHARPQRPANHRPEQHEPFTSTSERDRKCASITIRMSKAECDQLRQRAADAGLTISAYLRSCTFEAETLRAQVKDALAELRRANDSCANAGDAAAAKAVDSVKSSPLGWLRRLVPDLHSDRHLRRV